MVQVPRTALDAAIERYDPYEGPDPQQWLALDESERIDLVVDYHSYIGIRLPNERAHALIHAAVENQIAHGDELPVARTLQRLIAEGLDRHDALHAIGMELAAHMNELLKKGEAGDDPNRPYYEALERLTAASWLQSTDESDEGSMEAERILDGLAAPGSLPAEAIRAARANREVMAPVFVETIDRCVGAANSRSIRTVLFFIFHLLGEWREKSAYRSLAKLLCQPADEVDAIFGGATTETTHRVMAAVFDGDPQPLYDVILEPEADEFVRSRMCETLAMLSLHHEIPRAEAARFLRECYSDLRPRSACFVWNGWQSAIAMLGLAELKPFVKDAFRRGSISRSWLRFEDFEDDLHRVIERTDPPPWDFDVEYSLFGDTIEEFSGWKFDRDEHVFDETDADAADWVPPPPNVPAVNPFKGIGRNDPCPCGSGKKFKKCCLNSAP